MHRHIEMLMVQIWSGARELWRRILLLESGPGVGHEWIAVPTAWAEENEWEQQIWRRLGRVR